jgi:adenylate cyclase
MRELEQPDVAGSVDPATSPRIRRHAVVAFADIVSYTLLTSLDGDRVHQRWMSLLREGLEPLAMELGGRIVKSTGDGVAAEFRSADQAVAWAAALHRHVQATDSLQAPPIAFRVAVAEGEVDVTERDIYGACVNLAARLQDHAPAGGLAVTDAVRAALTVKPPMVDLGLLQLRNIPDPARVWVQIPQVPPRTPIAAATPSLPAVAVMPFDLAPGREEDRYLANGLIDDIVVSLGSLRDLAVIARGATLAWAGVDQDPRALGRMLGVRYVLTGSLRRTADRLRLRVDLRETEEGDSLWSDRTELAFAELFDMQDSIVERVVAGIAPSLRAAEVRRSLRKRPDSLTAYDLTLRGMHALDALRRDHFAEAGSMLQRAMHEDPAFATPVAWAAQWHSLAVGQSWSPTPDLDAQRAGDLAQQAVYLDPRNALGQAVAGHHRAYHLRDPASALPCFDLAIAACPNHALAWTLKSASLSYLGRGPEALSAAMRGFQLWPHGPQRYYFTFFVGLAHYASGEYAQAERWTRQSVSDNPGFTSAHKALMASLVALGRMDEAREIVDLMMGLEPGFRLRAYEAGRIPIVDQDLRQQLIAHMRLAGVPN